MHATARAVLAAFSLASVIADPATGAVEIRTVAVDGNTAPDGLGMWNSPNVGPFDQTGQMVFWSAANGSAPPFFMEGYWLSAPDDQVAPFFSFGQPALDGDEELSSIHPFTITESGVFGFGGYIRNAGNAGPSDAAIWTGTLGDYQLVAREGTPAPGVPGAELMFLVPQCRVSNTGWVAFNSMIGGPGIDAHNNECVLAGQPGDLQLIARTGDPAPGFDDAVFIDLGFWEYEMSINDTGFVVFKGRAEGAGIRGTGLWGGRVGEPMQLLHFFDVAPGEEYPHSEFIHVRALDDGRVAFGALEPGQGQFDGSMWIGQPGHIERVIGFGDPAPGIPEQRIRRPFGIQVTPTGLVGFASALIDPSATDGAPSEGLWAGTPDSPQLIARLGDPVPGHEGSVWAGWVGRLSLNDAGEFAFSARRHVAGETEARGKSVWLGDLAGRLELVAEEGADFELAPGVSRPVNYISRLGSHGNDFAVDFNEAGELAFSVFFESGAGVFVARLIDPCRADTDADNDVDLDDLAVLIFNFGSTAPIGDANKDGVVDLADLNILLSEFGNC